MAAADDDEDSSPPVRPLGHPANKELLAIISDIRLEAREHSRGLARLYDELRALPAPAPKHWTSRLVEELERHHTQDGIKIAALATQVAG